MRVTDETRGACPTRSENTSTSNHGSQTQASGKLESCQKAETRMEQEWSTKHPGFPGNFRKLKVLGTLWFPSRLPETLVKAKSPRNWPGRQILPPTVKYRNFFHRQIVASGGKEGIFFRAPSLSIIQANGPWYVVHTCTRTAHRAPAHRPAQAGKTK